MSANDTPALSLRGVTKSFIDGRGRRTEVLAGVDLDIAEGEFLAVIGYSGSGKSTLIAALAGLVDLDDGEILVRGVPSSGAGPDRGVVFQNYSLLPWATVQANVRLAVDAVHGTSSKQDRTDLTSRTIELVGLGHATDRKTRQLSGGMRQRVAVARALAGTPAILLLDEPLSALDALTRARLQDEIERIRQHEARTIVLVTNDVDEALLLADRVAVLGAGPRAAIARTFDVGLARPRSRTDLNHDPAYIELRKDIIACLESLGPDESARPFAAPRRRSGSSAPASTPGAGPSASLDLDAVTKAFPTPGGDLTVVDGFDLHVDQGEFVALIGHSGCGKSTVLSMVAGLSDVTSGEIRLDGTPIAAPGPDRAMVFQAPSLLPWLTAGQNVALGVDQVFRALPAEQRRMIVEDNLARVGLAEAIDKKASALSGGMRQRVGLARAFALQPRVLLLDEPFGMLDSLTRWALQDVLLEVWTSSRVTAVCVTHDVDEAILLADRVVMMTSGPHARVGAVMNIDLPRPRDRHEVLGDPRFYAYREAVLRFLADEGTAEETTAA